VKPSANDHAELGQVLQSIGRDVRTIATDELEMGRVALADRIESLVTKAGTAILGAAVALVGLAMLCLTGAFALHAVIAAMWLRMLIMSIVYIATGTIITLVVARRMGERHPGDLGHQVDEARDTLRAVTSGLKQ
jgi:hypothetical protein